MKKVMLANEAIAQGAYEAGVRVVSSYPGTPSTEITENIANYSEIYSEWAPNEKVALEVVTGASVAGARSMACMKHVGLNVAADPLFTLAYTGVNGGCVVVVADDPGMHSSQNEQDSRFYARSAHIPMLEPSDSQEAKDYTKLAFELSERFDTPVLLRTTTRVAHSQSVVELEGRQEIPLRPYVKDVSKYTMMPASAKLRHVAVEKRENELKQYVNTAPFNSEEINDTDLGVVCSGVVYQYVKEVLPTASVYKLGMVYPLPVEALVAFSKKVKRLIVIEELEPFFENQLKAAGVKCEGKSLFTLQGEYSVNGIKKALLGIESPVSTAAVPVRPPVMCSGCPHRGVFYVLNKLKLTVTADIGCYTLGAQKPLSAVDTVLCMGASVGMNHGFNKATGSGANTVAVIGDSTFIHSGITGLINCVYNKGNTTLIILDNSTTGMTGHQDHAATGKTLRKEPTAALDLPTLVAACGVKNVTLVDAYDMAAVEKAIVTELARDEVSVIIAKRPCALLTKVYKEVDKITDKCRKCGRCMKIGCPSICKAQDGTISINPSLCTGCGLCEQMCPFGAIEREVK